MGKIKITEKDNPDVIKGWYEEAKKQTLDTIHDFIQHVLNDYEHDYGTICHAVTVCSIAGGWTANNSSPVGHITFFQAGMVMWNFIRNWSFSDNKCGLKMLDFDDMLYPQYEYHFEKEIDEDTWADIQKEAKRLLESHDNNNPLTVNPHVKKHWESIVAGNIPFGFKLKTKRG